MFILPQLRFLRRYFFSSPPQDLCFISQPIHFKSLPWALLKSSFIYFFFWPDHVSISNSLKPLKQKSSQFVIYANKCLIFSVFITFMFMNVSLHFFEFWNLKVFFLAFFFFLPGSSSGIGRATALALARRGARVILACRSKERGEAAAFDIRRVSARTQAPPSCSLHQSGGSV